MAIAVNVDTVRRRHWRYFLVLTSDKYFQLTTIQVSYNSIVCNGVEHVEFCGNYDLRTALIFCYHLKKTAAESHRILVEAYGELLVNHSALSDLKNSKVAILTWETKNVENHRKSLRIANCKHCWMKMTLKLNSNNSRINWMRHKKPSSYVWNLWESSRRWENGFHMNWMKDSRKTEKSLAKITARQVQKKVISSSNCDWRKVDIFLRILSVKDHE